MATASIEGEPEMLLSDGPSLGNATVAQSYLFKAARVSRASSIYEPGHF